MVLLQKIITISIIIIYYYYYFIFKNDDISTVWLNETFC